MSAYPDRYPRGNFTVHCSITHDPTGFKFLQQGGKIVVLDKGEDGMYRAFAEFTTPALQITGTYLTEAALIRAAIVWLKDNLK